MMSAVPGSLTWPSGSGGRDTLRPARGARGVQHGRAARLVGERLVRRGGDGVLVAAVALGRAAEGQPQPDPGVWLRMAVAVSACSAEMTSALAPQSSMM